MADQDTRARASSFSGPPISATTPDSDGIKLPLLTARPGNVGVQIDSHRSMSLISHPRSGQFTANFHGFMYENGSLENYSRVVERTAQRARILEDKIDKLRAREQYLVDDEEKRKQRRVQREASRQRRSWQARQAAKRDDERAREDAAAVTVQRVVRGALARRTTRIMRQVRKANNAARMLQHAMKTYLCRQNMARERERRKRAEEERRENEMHSAASVLQRQARKRLQAVHQSRARASLASMAEDEEDEEDDANDGNDENEENEDGAEDEKSNDGEEHGNRNESEEAASGLPVVEQTSPTIKLSVDEKVKAEALSRGISLDLLFSDDEDGGSVRDTDDTMSSSSTLVSENTDASGQPPPTEDAAARRPNRPLSVKRAGGGYRARPLSPATKSSEKANGSATCATTEDTSQSMKATEPSSMPTNDSLHGSPRSPTIPKQPTVGSARNILTSQPAAVVKPDDSNSVRPPSPVQKRFKSPYAVPQRLNSQ